MDLDPYEVFREQLRDALNHLHDPDYRAPPALASTVARESAVSTSSVQYAIIEAIRHLAPPSDTPDSASIQRSYDLLVHRFIEGLTQDETAARLHTTVRSVRREQRVATHMLARLLWEHRGRSASVPAGDNGLDPNVPPSNQWRSQAKRELASLRQTNPVAVADVGSVIRRAVALERTLVEGYGVALAVGDISDDLTATVHPTALRQVLIMAIGWLSRSGHPREIRLDAWQEAGSAALRLTGAGCSDLPKDDTLVAEMLHLLDGSLTTAVVEGFVHVTLRVPAVGRVTVVVVDDNPDFIHFCRRCVRGTRYRILQPEGWTAAAIQKASPHVILLDIMLPDADGWELLQSLQRDTAMASIPVVICSIVRAEDLASLMGAVEYLPKPVQHQDLLATLDRVAG